ncbi:hypothetical protein KI387_024410, partial [Taxus chinensis]
LPGLPLHLWDDEILLNIAKSLGSPIGLDGPTRNRSRLAFARFCIVSAIDQEFPEHIILKTRFGSWTQRIEVETLRCKRCQSIGHSDENCNKKKTPLLVSVQPEIDADLNKVNKDPSQERKTEDKGPSQRNVQLNSRGKKKKKGGFRTHIKKHLVWRPKDASIASPNNEVVVKTMKASPDKPFETSVKDDLAKDSLEVNEQEGLIPSGSDEKEILTFIREEACNKENMDVSEPLAILSSGETGNADPLPYLSISTASAQDCCSLKTASGHTPDSIHKEQKVGGITPTMEKKTFLIPSGSEEKEILPFVRKEACIKEDMRVFEPLESLPTGEKGIEDPLPYLSMSTVTEQVCYNHTPVNIHKEQEEGEITPAKEKEDPDSG